MEKTIVMKNLSKLTEVDRKVLLAYSTRTEESNYVYTTEATTMKEIHEV